MKNLQLGIIGSAGVEEYKDDKPNKSLYIIARALGKLIAKNNAILVCGGKGGIMTEAAKGAKENGGTTVGVVSGNLRGTSNEFIDVEVVSGMINCGEENLIISMSDAIIAVGGGAGTLQELALAYRNNKPLVLIRGFGGWSDKVSQFLDERKTRKFETATTAQEAFKKLQVIML